MAPDHSWELGAGGRIGRGEVSPHPLSAGSTLGVWSGVNGGSPLGDVAQRALLHQAKPALRLRTRVRSTKD
jgi:hypothetical protein